MNTDQQLINQFFKDHPEVAMQFIERLEINEIAALLASLPAHQCAYILSHLPIFQTSKILALIPAPRSIELMEILEIKVVQSILSATQKDAFEQILKGISKEKASYLRRALKYPKDQVGGHIEPFVLTLLNSTKVETAVTLIKENSAIVKPHIFVTDEHAQLIGYVALVELMVADAKATLKSILKQVSKPAFAEMQVNDLLAQWDDSFMELPVVNVHGTFLGIVARSSLSAVKERKKGIDNSAVNAGNALGELYFIGLTSLLGNSTGSTSQKL